MSFTDPRLPGKEYKTERGLKAALRYFDRNSNDRAKVIVNPEVEEDSISLEPVEYTHIRNIHGGPVRIRLTGEKREDSRSIRLQGRGQRGDTVAVTEAERRSIDYANNINLLFEAITKDEADKIYYNQTTNQQAVHPILGALRNENGQPMTDGVSIKPEFNHEQSITVAREVVKQNGKMDLERVAVQRGMPMRANLPGTEDRPASSYARDNIDTRTREIQADQVARSNLQGPESGLAGFTVKMPARVHDPALIAPISPVTGSDPR